MARCTRCRCVIPDGEGAYCTRCGDDLAAEMERYEARWEDDWEHEDPALQPDRQYGRATDG